MDLKEHLNKIYNYNFNSHEKKWILSGEDGELNKEVVSFLLENNVKTHLDIACGSGKLVELCRNNNIESFGIDPIKSNKDYLFTGTFSTFKELFKNLPHKVDAITITGTLHGKHFHQHRVIELLDVIFKNCKVLVISHPRWDELRIEPEKTGLVNFKKIKNFKLSHKGKTTEHYGYIKNLQG